MLKRFWKIAPAIGVALLSGGCGLYEASVFNPKGPIMLAERDLMFEAIGIMMVVIIPAFFLTALFLWRYRGTNRKARYTPNLAYYWPVEVVVWGVPAIIIIWLSFHLWHNTYKLDPYRAIDPSVKALEVEVIAQDWKWLFIYPEQDIAVVNELVFPSGRPLSLRITSDTVMNSFMIQALGGQIFAMAGMQTKLHLLADEPGKFWGRNVQYSGTGFADQQFRAIATTKEDFNAWVEKVKGASATLDTPTYEALLKPSQKVPVTYYSGAEPNLFDTIIAKYAHNDADLTPSTEAAVPAP